ncbi:uncharacterized protein LOC144534161 isoform X2 [Sander vitreus]
MIANTEVTSEPNPKTKALSTVGKAPSSESQEADSTQNPGVFRGVMQNVNPFKSTHQVFKAASSESLEQERVSDTNQNPGMLKGVMQKVNPFKRSAQVPKSDPQNDAADPPEKGKEFQGKQNPSMIAAMMQKVNPFKSSQPQEHQAIHSEHSSSSDSVDDSTIKRHVRQ